jgi:ATP phosphoribosyltransferase
VAAYLREQGAQHIWRGEVWDDQGGPGWRVTALVAAGKLTAYQRRLFDLGAGRVVGLPARFVFDRNRQSTFDDLRTRLDLGSGSRVKGQTREL